jgi:hypothetical protein
MNKKLRVAFAVISVVSLLHVLYLAAVSVAQTSDDDELFRPPPEERLVKETEGFSSTSNNHHHGQALEQLPPPPPQSRNRSSSTTVPQDDDDPINRTTTLQNHPPNNTHQLDDEEAIINTPRNTTTKVDADLTPTSTTIGETSIRREKPSNTNATLAGNDDVSSENENLQKPNGTKATNTNTNNTIPAVIQQNNVSSRQVVSTGTPNATYYNDHSNNNTAAASKPTTTTTITTISRKKFEDGNNLNIKIKKSSFIQPNTTDDAPQQVITAVVAVYQQPYCLQQIVQYLRTCPIIKEIRVNWFQNTTLPKPDEVEEYFVPPTYYYNHSNDITNSSYLAPIHFDNVQDKISHRFKPRDWKTDAIFHVDADTFYSCAAIELAYQTWISNGPNKTAVGFHSRHLTKGRFYRFSASYQSPFQYSTLFITKGGITHRDALDVFFSSKYQKLRDMVDEHITGEDMLMSFVLASSGIQTIGVCLEPGQTCAVDCAQGRQKGLVQRTAQHRPTLLKKYFQELGDPFVSKQGADEMVWQTKNGERSKSYRNKCYSNPFGRTSAGVAPYCVYFCKGSGTGVCPKNPKRKSNATVWTPISIFHEKGVITELPLL